MNIRSVLLVDDDPNLRLVTQMTLEEVGEFEVTAAASGFEAVEYAQKKTFDLILLDVMMPGMDGPQTFAKLKELLPSTPPVIFLTAKVQRPEMAAYLNLGAAGVISKPFDPMTLPAEIQDIVKNYRSSASL